MHGTDAAVATVNGDISFENRHGRWLVYAAAAAAAVNDKISSENRAGWWLVSATI